MKPERNDDVPVTFTDWLGITDAPRWWLARPLGPIVSVLLVLLFVLALAAAVVMLIRSFGAEDAGLGTGGLIVALLGAPFLIWATVLKHQTLRYQKEGHITERITKAVEQLGAEKTVKKEGKESTEPNIEVRIGAILSLERIAQDSTKYDKGRDHVRVMEILCAYIRENAPASKAKDHDFGEWEPLKDNPTAEERAAHVAKREERFGRNYMEGKVYEWAQALPEPRADIAIALRVIGRRDGQQRLAEARWGKDAKATDTWVFDIPCPELPDGDGPTSAAALETFQIKFGAWREKIESYRGYRLDLRKTCLQRADLSNLCFSGASMQGARMEGASLWLSRVGWADLTRARMEGANFCWARMEGVMCGAANLEETLLQGARMQGALLQDARMEGASLHQVRLQRANLTEARMERVMMYRAWMQLAILSEARMEGVLLLEARMEGAYLNAARMEGADLTSTRLEGANLSAARLEGTKLLNARLDSATKLDGAVFSKSFLKMVDISDVSISLDQLNSMFGDASVTLPNNITPDSPDWPAHWPKEVLERVSFLSAYDTWLAAQP
jgi:uncharacterized protein YjbI with pentapeptide repeats